MGILSSVMGFFGGSAYEGGNRSPNRIDRAYSRSRSTDEDRNVGQWGREKLRLECRDAYRNDSITYGAVNRVADYVVGPDGLLPQAKTSDPAWNQAAEDYFWEWGKIADYRRRLDWRQIQRTDIISLFTDGESGAILTDSGQLQPVDAERIGTPVDLVSYKRILEGVKLSADGIPLSYYVLSRDENGRPDFQRFEEVGSPDFVHFLDHNRADQVRGIPYLAPLINQMRDYAQLNKSLLTKANIDAFQSWVIKTNEGAKKATQLGPRRSSTEVADPSESQTYERFDGHRTYYLRPGEDVQSLSSSTPNPQFVEFCRHHLRAIAAGIGIPYEFLLLDFSGGSFAQSRAALMIAYRRFASLQTLLEKKCQRVWNWRIAKAIKEGDLPPAPAVDGVSEWYKVEWQRPRYDWIDPQAQVDAEKAALALGTESHSSIAKKYGRDSLDIMREKARDIANAKMVAAENGVDDWRDIIDWTANPQRTVTDNGDKLIDGKEPEGLAKWLT